MKEKGPHIKNLGLHWGPLHSLCGYFFMCFFQQTRVYPYTLGAGSARPNPKMALRTQKTLYFQGFLCSEGDREGARPWGTLKTVTSLNKEARLLKFHFSYAIIVFRDNELKCSKCYDRKAKIAFRISKCCNR